MTIKIAHISDLHFSHLTFSPSQFFSKRWIGNINLIFSRKQDYQPEKLQGLADYFAEAGVTHLFITGDLSTTSLDEEFKKAKDFIESFEKVGIQVFAIPGNHDHYTKSSYKENTFYYFFKERFTETCPFSLKTNRVTASRLSPKWWIAAMDTAYATSLISSRGRFSENIETELRTLLSKIPKDENILILNHFPLFQNDSPRKELLRADALQKLLRGHPNVKLYLHGHSHRHCIADLRSCGYPVVLDSGSTARHREGTWNLLELFDDRCNITAFQHKNGDWTSFKNAIVQW